jgi:hypothetical protein
MFTSWSMGDHESIEKDESAVHACNCSVYKISVPNQPALFRQERVNLMHDFSKMFVVDTTSLPGYSSEFIFTVNPLCPKSAAPVGWSSEFPVVYFNLFSSRFSYTKAVHSHNLAQIGPLVNEAMTILSTVQLGWLGFCRFLVRSQSQSTHKFNNNELALSW